ncbi:cysteine hydrolase [Ruegeria lacuscaerulensis]|uniref:cysteine hydrolase n=1 Tax=Ruegeria lacuscaerulensis TaxID=55218 RepID=UPI001BE444C5|nr:cysteine hydrolase [Ruegeria lacuscaerulensis]
MTEKATPQNAGMILIDHQIGTMNWARSVDIEIIKANTRALARTAVDLGMPIVFTSSMEDQIQGP